MGTNCSPDPSYIISTLICCKIVLLEKTENKMNKTGYSPLKWFIEILDRKLSVQLPSKCTVQTVFEKSSHYAQLNTVIWEKNCEFTSTYLRSLELCRLEQPDSCFLPVRKFEVLHCTVLVLADHIAGNIFFAVNKLLRRNFVSHFELKNHKKLRKYFGLFVALS